MLINDRKITVSMGNSRKATKWFPSEMWWSEFIDRLRVAVRSTESLAVYNSLPKSKQDELKDVGGYVLGEIKSGGRRKAANVIGRDAITLDLDNIPPGGTQDVLRRVEALGCAWTICSTRKHEESRPRLRVLAPLNRTATADEYEPLARKLASIIGIELCDPTTFEASRLMYFPSCCSDSTYIYQYGDKPFLDTDGLLATYADWRNVAEWPEVPGAQQTRVKLAARQGDPVTKTGIVGAFCKTYDIYRAMETFIPGEYTLCDDAPDRYTYTGGSTTGGAVVYDNGNFMYSHHATDPTSGKLVNAFDLVRLHRFAALDDEAKPDTPTNKLPSYAAMCQLVVSDTPVAALLNQERYEKATQDFATAPDDNANWMAKLKKNLNTGAFLKTIENVRVVLECDPLLKGRIWKDEFASCIQGTAPLPWNARPKENNIFRWIGEDDNGLRGYMEKLLGFSSREIIEVALHNHASSHSFNPVVAYLNSLIWDDIGRLDTLFIDYLGADDTPYTRAVTRKALTAAVARAMTPGCKFDQMTVICGRQGLGKSTLLSKLGKNWFSDSLQTFEGKEAAELLQGVWILEVAELGAYSKSGVRMVKQSLSKCDDQFRAAYARKTEKHPRRCVFFGTTNDHEYLQDPTGNRRFWPVDAGIQKPTKNIFVDLDEELDQMWAEAVVRWQLGESLRLSDELEAEAEKRREGHKEYDSLQGVIEGFLERPVPEDWHKWGLERRRIFWGGGLVGPMKLVYRDRVCALEIWRECLCDNRANMPKYEAIRINNILVNMPGWERVSTNIRIGPDYGRQKGFKRTDTKPGTILRFNPVLQTDDQPLQMS